MLLAVVGDSRAWPGRSGRRQVDCPLQGVQGLILKFQDATEEIPRDIAARRMMEEAGEAALAPLKVCARAATTRFPTASRIHVYALSRSNEEERRTRQRFVPISSELHSLPPSRLSSLHHDIGGFEIIGWGFEDEIALLTCSREGKPPALAEHRELELHPGEGGSQLGRKIMALRD